ncbi:4-hydroxybenzoate octaprenyltransferase [Taibaiella sp. KBW10]|uniref:UbiA-like polyprenyltransferase n=1 Tax=Taibaiella sp. KBW10 TaxID=2153357 RepID=UPI000F5A9BEE|nr:UbiA-like polyprenyltransferase [Taibaiella sp. KBW10]RQO31071.1 4-hydroxybenzoate octaprenyltransferase [Taibaiella sp. KBW10]
MKKYLSLVKFSHTIFALPFALIGFALAVFYKQDYAFDWKILLLMLVCMVTARNAAMAFNRFLDRKFDAKNPRTASREVPAGLISANNALVFTIVNALLFMTATYFINPLCFYLSPVALFVVLFYSYTKRFTALCHLVLGVGLALAPIGAYLTITGTFDMVPLFFSFIVLTWVSGFDIIYALQDEEFDKDHHLNSIPAALGKKNALMVSNVLHVISASLIIAVGFYAGFHWVYWIGAAIVLSLLVYQHTLVKPHDLSKVNLAFGTTNGIISLVFAVFTITDLLLA